MDRPRAERWATSPASAIEGEYIVLSTVLCRRRHTIFFVDTLEAGPETPGGNVEEVTDNWERLHCGHGAH